MAMTKEERAEYNKWYREHNRERMNEQKRAWYQRNKERLKQSKKNTENSTRNHSTIAKHGGERKTENIITHIIASITRDEQRGWGHDGKIYKSRKDKARLSYLA